MADRRRLLAAAALVAAALALLLLRGSGGGSGAATAHSSASGGATGRVERRTLAERLTTAGAIGYAGETTVLARLAGTVTALPAVGDVIHRGGRLYAVSGEAVLLLYGSVPAYRTLAEGISDGRDVEQLEANLAAFGYEPGTVDEEFTYATAEAVAAWQEDLGLQATGEVELGRVAFLRGPQRVTALEATLGEALGAGGGGGASANTMVAWEPEAEGLGEAAEATEPEKGEAGPEEEDRREPEEESRPPRAEKPKAEPEHQPEEEKSEAEPPSVAVLRTSSTRRIVSVELEADQQSIAHRGQKVEVVLPSGAEVRGEVTGLAALAASGGEGGPGEEAREAGVEATVSVTGRDKIPALDGASVSVRFTQQVRKNVLSVPLTALIAIGSERFAVYVREGGARRQIVVVPGLAADGYVEVEGKGLKAGMQVETGE